MLNCKIGCNCIGSVNDNIISMEFRFNNHFIVLKCKNKKIILLIDLKIIWKTVKKYVCMLRIDYNMCLSI